MSNVIISSRIFFNTQTLQLCNMTSHASLKLSSSLKSRTSYKTHSFHPCRTFTKLPYDDDAQKFNFLLHRLQLQSKQVQFSSVFMPRQFLRTTSFTLDQNENEVLGRGEKVLKLRLSSVRLDTALKAGLALSRNKVEKALYQDRIRLNGERPHKKSQTLSEGDEIDVVRGINKANPKFLDVSRVEILEIHDENESDQKNDSDSDSDDDGKKTPVVIRRCKVLTIQNYETPWKGNDMLD